MSQGAEDYTPSHPSPAATSRTAEPNGVVQGVFNEAAAQISEAFSALTGHCEQANSPLCEIKIGLKNIYLNHFVLLFESLSP